jgi:hypothetical protein
VACVVYNYDRETNPNITLFRVGFASPLQRQISVYLQGCESMTHPFYIPCPALSQSLINQLELRLELAMEKLPGLVLHQHPHLLLE